VRHIAGKSFRVQDVFIEPARQFLQRASQVAQFISSRGILELSREAVRVNWYELKLGTAAGE
jgi:hypothetical protein